MERERYTPPPLSLPLPSPDGRTGLAALKTGWHIPVENPLALSLDDARGMAIGGKEKGLEVSAGQNYRFQAGLGTM